MCPRPPVMMSFLSSSIAMTLIMSILKSLTLATIRSRPAFIVQSALPGSARHCSALFKYLYLRYLSFMTRTNLFPKLRPEYCFPILETGFGMDFLVKVFNIIAPALSCPRMGEAHFWMASIHLANCQVAKSPAK